MATVTFILGYCGSGKSYHAAQFEAAGARKFDEGFAAPENLATNLRELALTLQRGRDCAVIEIAFCYQQCRDFIVQFLQANVPNAQVHWVAFEPNLAIANQNCRRRKNKGAADEHIRINQDLGAGYTVPQGVEPMPIYELSEDGY